MTFCPCGSNKQYIECCEVYHTNQEIALTPEALMRSRYSAYAMAKVAYIKKTMRGKPLLGFNESEAEHWTKSIQWLKLEVVKSYLDSADSQIGFVEFIAKYLQKDVVHALHELSEFHLSDGHWYYVDGKQYKTTPEKIARNAPCPCGSKKKFKNCKHN